MGLRSGQQRADIAVILGNKVNEDGTLSERLTQRLACGLALYRSGRVGRLLVSGGLGKEGFWEGNKMREYLRAQGVPDSVIIVDNRGNDTQQTVRNTLRLRRRSCGSQCPRRVAVLPHQPHQNAVSAGRLCGREWG